jgi:hypothetical protein
MSDLLPIFPLPNVVLFPNVFLPLHVFEPRYRSMVADALTTDRLIGMALLKPGWEQDYHWLIVGPSSSRSERQPSAPRIAPRSAKSGPSSRRCWRRSHTTAIRERQRP